MVARSDPATARELLNMAQNDVERQWRVYVNRAAMAGRSETPHAAPPEKETRAETVKKTVEEE
jgi:hypothetical protein